jgi:type IV secretory pathway VirB10-like protein
MTKSLLDRLKDTQTRALLVLGIAILIFVSILTYFIIKKPDPVATEESRATKLPEITAIPGGITSERYQELLEEENRKRAETAKKAGTSAVATIIGARKREGTDTFGIEGLLKTGECKCNQTDNLSIPDLDPARAGQLLADLQANPDNALQLLKQNPGLGKALCKKNPTLALQLMAKDSEIAKIILTECPELASTFAEKNPELYKQLMATNPELAKKIADYNANNIPDLDPIRAAQLLGELQANPENALQLLKQNPGLGKALCKQNPALALQLMTKDKEIAKTILTECPALAQKFAEKSPELYRQLMAANPDLAKRIADYNANSIPDLDPIRAAQLLADLQANPDNALQLLKQNPGLGKALCKQNPTSALQLMEKDTEIAKVILAECPELAQKFAENNPELFKKLVLANPDLAKRLAQSNPALFKKLMAEDPQFAKQFANSNPDAVKTMMQNDRAFANTMAIQNPDMVKEFMQSDPIFAATLLKNNPDAVMNLMQNDADFANALAKSNPAAVKDLLLKNPDFAQAMAKSNPALLADLAQADPLFAKNLEQKNPGISATLPKGNRSSLEGTDKERARAAAMTRAKQLEALNAQQRPLKLNEQQQRQVQTLISGMEGQSKAIFQAWNEFSPQQYMQGQWAPKEESKKDTTINSTGQQSASSTIGGSSKSTNMLFKAGTILFAVLDTAINSDEPGPVMATIVDGKYRGAKLLGSMSATSQPGGQAPKKVTLTFNLMNTTDFPNSIGIQAVAIDPDTARTALASDVDNHYLLRYGTMFASAFMSGYAKVITSQGTVQTTSANGLSSTTTTPQLTGRKELFAALGEVGKKWSDTVASLINIPPTVTVDAGVGVGILFLTDVSGG